MDSNSRQPDRRIDAISKAVRRYHLLWFIAHTSLATLSAIAFHHTPSTLVCAADAPLWCQVLAESPAARGPFNFATLSKTAAHIRPDGGAVRRICEPRLDPHRRHPQPPLHALTGLPLPHRRVIRLPRLPLPDGDCRRRRRAPPPGRDGGLPHPDRLRRPPPRNRLRPQKARQNPLALLHRPRLSRYPLAIPTTHAQPHTPSGGTNGLRYSHPPPFSLLSLPRPGRPGFSLDPPSQS